MRLGRRVSGELTGVLNLLVRFLVVFQLALDFNGVFDVLLVLLNEVLSLTFHVLYDLSIHFLDLLQVLLPLLNAKFQWLLLPYLHKLLLLH